MRRLVGILMVICSSITTPLFAQAPLGIDPRKPCVDSQCHAGLDQGRFIHGPVAVGQCVVCHTPLAGKQHRFKPSANGRALCQSCHDPLKLEPVVHEPVAKGDCLKCHTIHTSSQRHLLKQEMNTLCLSCHESIAKPATDLHIKMLQERRCHDCHAVHSSPAKKLLRQSEAKLCLSCHVDLAKQLQAAVFKHGPLNQEKCHGCHAPHGPGVKGLLTQPLDKSFYLPYTTERYGFCFSCHARALVEAPTTDTATQFRNGKTNLHYVHTNRAPKGRNCLVCHDIHGSDNAKLVRPNVDFGQWQVPIQFTSTASGGSCITGCHQQYVYDRLQPSDYEKK